MLISDIDSPESRKKLVDLSDPEVAEVVRSLHLRPYSDAKCLPPPRQKRTWARIARPHSKKGREGRTALSNLRCLTNLETLDLQCESTDDVDAFKHVLPSLKLSWSGFSTTLRTLSLRVPLECYSGLFSSSLHLPRLTKLTFHIFASHHSTNPVDPMCSTLAPFINRHAPSLESLSVITPQTGTADLSPMFYNLRFFPRLTSLTLLFCVLSLEYIHLQGIQEFLSSHSYQLEDVTLHFRRMIGLKTEEFRADSFFSLPVFRVPLHSLKSLDIGFTGFRDVTGLGTMSYVHRFQKTLQSLVLRDIMLSPASLLRLVAPLECLRRLDVAVLHFTPAILDTLSTTVPDLTELSLSFISYSGAEGRYKSVDDPQRPHKFCAEMSRRLYPGWNLRHLKTHILSNGTPTFDAFAGMTRPNVELCLRTLAAALPCLQTIDGQRRSTVLQQERSRTAHWNLSVYDN